MARITAEKMEVHVKAMEATKQWAEEQRDSARTDQEARAIKAAARIQAEAKARARVAGEAAIIQAKAMARATEAFEYAQEQVRSYQAEY